MNSRGAIGLMLLAVVAGACDRDPIAPADGAGSIRPLAVGSRWISDVRELDEDGSELRRYQDTVEIESEEVIDGERWFVTNQGTRLADRADGNWARVGGGTMWRTAKYPASVGDTTDIGAVPTFDPGADTLRFVATVTSIDRLVTVPAGTFRCHEYAIGVVTRSGLPYYPAAAIDTFHFAVGVGPVRASSGLPSGDRRISELTRYTLK